MLLVIYITLHRKNNNLSYCFMNKVARDSMVSNLENQSSNARWVPMLLYPQERHCASSDNNFEQDLTTNSCIFNRKHYDGTTKESISSFNIALTIHPSWKNLFDSLSH